MSDSKIRRLVIVGDGKVQGVVAIGDLAARDRFVDEAGEALSHISTPTRQQRLSQ
jgi:CBS domain-containing protein